MNKFKYFVLRLLGVDSCIFEFQLPDGRTVVRAVANNNLLPLFDEFRKIATEYQVAPWDISARAIQGCKIWGDKGRP